MKIKDIHIKGIGGIKDLHLEFNDGFNLLCGTNGVGKTTILDCISTFFLNRSHHYLKRNCNFQVGKASIHLCVDDAQILEFDYEVYEYNINEPIKFFYNKFDENREILYFKSIRSIGHSVLNSLNRDTDKTYENINKDIINGISSVDIKNWFVNRFLFSVHENALTEEQLRNYNIAKNIFSCLDKEVFFSKVLPATYDIILNTKQGEIFFEYLSAGYKSCVYILLGIVKEIEFRFKDDKIKVTDFDGVILIDEIDLHLHPQWQSTLVKNLKELLPKAQIIATTHSPSIIQCAEPSEVIPLVFDENNNVKIKDLNVNEYGFQGWSIEEILKDVMGMETTNSELYLRTIKEFDDAMDNENYTVAKDKCNILRKMLHPTNPLNKILEIQMAGLED